MPPTGPLRSVLFVPGDKPRLLDKARTFAADAVILDLEDAVAPEEKVAARGTIRQALEAGTYGPRVVLRINAFGTGLAERDLEEALAGPVSAVCLPKVDGAADIERLVLLLRSLEAQRGWPEGQVSVLALIETAQGVLNAYSIARASERLWALCLGGEDLARDLGAVRSREGLELGYARAHLVLAARAAGCLAIDTVYTDLQDAPGLEAETRHARQLGYSGKLLIHPGQIEPVHRAFAPSTEEIAWARRVLQAFEAAIARGDGVVALDGKMIDRPVVARASEILAMTGDGP
jgi:citrate lyase subunit beta / citryl-CoA lyase